MPTYGRHFERGQLQFITTSYLSAAIASLPASASAGRLWTFLRQLRDETGFLLLGWVLMPDHFHLLIRPEPPKATVRFMQELKKRSAQQTIAALARNQDHPRCRTFLARPATPLDGPQ